APVLARADVRPQPERARDPRAARRGRDDPLRIQGARQRHARARRHDGLRLRPRLHGGEPRGVRAPDPRRPARRPAPLPPPRGGRAVLAHPRSHRGVLGLAQGAPRTVRAGLLGPRFCRCPAGAGWPRLEAPVIIDLNETTVSTVAKRLVSVREEGGAVALGRVLTLIIKSDHRPVEEAIEAANDASREHPMRVIVLVTHPDDAPRLDAQIRVGGDAGASEVVILRAHGEAASNPESLVTGLLLPDAPVVVWWPETPPEAPALDPLGRIAQRRITDASTSPAAAERLQRLDETYRPGD